MKPIKELLLTRMIDAPRELVFKAFTDPAMMQEWWGPHGFTNSECEIDAQPGGAFKICMQSPEFPNHWCNGKFIEVIKPEKIIFTARAFLDENDNAGIENIVTVHFETINSKTKLTLYVEVTKIAEEVRFAMDGMGQGWTESLERLENMFSKIKS